jgi:hypothetical protein
MGIEAVIRRADQSAVESPLAGSRLVPNHKQDGPSPGIECEGRSPFPSSGAEAQLLHVRVTGAFERVDPWPAQLGAKPLEQAGQRENFCSHVFVQPVKLQHKLVADLNYPAHTHNMAYDQYGVKYILQSAGQFVPA